MWSIVLLISLLMSLAPFLVASLFCSTFVFRICLASSIEMVSFWSLSSIHFLLCWHSSLHLWALCSYSQFLVLCVLRICCHYCCVSVEAMVTNLEAIILLGTPNLLKLPSSSQGFQRKVEMGNGAWMLSWLFKQEQEVSALLSPLLQFQAPIHPHSCCLDIQSLLS
jgi:hypothetical protein